jgi:hypothetical protein
VTILTAGEARPVPRASKAEVARSVLDAVVELRAHPARARTGSIG